MTRSKNSGGSSQPTPIDEGPVGATLPNSKTTARKDAIPAPSDDLTQSGKFGTSSHFGGETSRNTADKSGTVPDPSILNRGYTPNVGAGPQPSRQVSSNRVYGIPEPTVVLGGDSEDDDSPVKPSYGVGTTGE